jgi:hypothetical protein
MFYILDLERARQQFFFSKEKQMYYWIAGVVIVGLLHPAVDYYLTHCYKAYSSHVSKLYIRKNVVKSCVLTLLTPLALPTMYQAIINDRWDWEGIQGLGLMYGMCDAYSLVRHYDILHPSTRFHHSIVSIYSIANLYIHSPPWKYLNVFAAFSILTFPVNYYLGMRHLVSQDSKQRLAKISFYVYSPVILVNLMYQAAVVYTHPSILYGLVVLFLLVDDAFLMRHIFQNS